MTAKLKQRYILHPAPAGGHIAAARAQVLSNLQGFLARLPVTTGWIVEVKRLRKTRTPKQRKSLFGVAYKPIMEHIGLEGDQEKRELHRYFCGEFFGWAEDAIGRPIPWRTTTTNENGDDDEIDTETANRMYAFIQRRAAETGIDVPDPDPLWFEQGKDDGAQRSSGM